MGPWLPFIVTHALYRDFLYDHLLSKRRVLLHRRAGETLERVYGNQGARIAGSLASHFERGRDFSRAVTYFIGAGETALSRFAYAEAAGHYSHGLGLVDRLTEQEQGQCRAVLLNKRGSAYLSLGCLPEAAADYAAMREACRAAGNLEGESRAAIGQTTVAFHLREVDDCARYARVAMALAERTGNDALIAQAGVQWGVHVGVNRPACRGTESI
jgi:predicted ATPase